MFDKLNYINHENECVAYKEQILKKFINHQWISSIHIDTIKINDYIYVDYTPLSQKNLYSHLPECGKVVEILDDNNIFIINHKKEKINIIKYGFGLYSSCYDMSLYILQ